MVSMGGWNSAVAAAPRAPGAADRLPESAPGRSPVPDLLFEDVRAARLGEIRHLLEDPGAAADAPLHRITVFLTFRCNLACRYCRTARRPAAGAATFSPAAFRSLLRSHAGREIRHVHFTGGEAALVPGFAGMVRNAKAAGVGATSLTSNGTLPVRTYLGLVAAGMDEIRISLDADSAAAGDALAGRTGAWARTVAAVRALAAARRAGAPFFLVLNAVVGDRDAAGVARTVRFLISLGADDVKLIAQVDARGPAAAAAPGADAARAEVEALLAAVPEDAYPLLRRKARTVFAPDAVGLATAAGGAWRCFVPLTERTVDAAAYHPCSVYLREGGSPIGPAGDPPSVQSERTTEWVRRSACLDDSICRRYCLHCTRLFNEEANAAGIAGAAA